MGAPNDRAEQLGKLMHTATVIVATSLAILLCGLFWIGLFVRNRTELVPARSLFRTVLVAGFLCRLAFVFLTPIYYAPDEQPHINYIKYISEHNAFPVLTTKLGDPANEWEYCQPPLYYLLLVPVFRAVTILFHSVAAAVWVLRLFSVLLWFLHVFFASRLL